MRLLGALFARETGWVARVGQRRRPNEEGVRRWGVKILASAWPPPSA